MIHLNHPHSQGNEKLGERMQGLISASAYKSAEFAVAYATVAGVRTFVEMFGADFGGRAVVGLDDAVTQPGALEFLQAQPNLELRVASLAEIGARFHPKFLRLGSGVNSDTLIVGSANLTKAALSNNAEACLCLTLPGPVENQAASSAFDCFWDIGIALTAQRLSDYKKLFDRAKVVRSKLELITNQSNSLGKRDILSNDSAQVDPTVAKRTWIECGNVTALGRELELKAEQALFFGVSPHGAAAKFINVRTSAGNITAVKLKYQPNHMWRVQMNGEIPEVAAGLRPTLPNGSLGRSTYVAVFENIGNNTFDLKFLPDTSNEYLNIVKSSKYLGTYGKTTARQYGWL